MILTDEIEVIKDRYYVVANAILNDWDSNELIQVKAMAREEENKKGMDASQVTGSCSSYARKYALNGLFNLDDTKDADTDEQHEAIQNAQTKQQKAENNDKLDEIRMRCFKAQNELQKIGIDTHSEAFCEHLKAEYKINSQDIPNLNGNGLVGLIKAYGAIYKENAKAEGGKKNGISKRREWTNSSSTGSIKQIKIISRIQKRNGQIRKRY